MKYNIIGKSFGEVGNMTDIEMGIGHIERENNRKRGF